MLAHTPKQQTLKISNSSKDMTRILRGLPARIDIDHLLYQEAKVSVLHGPNNNINYYSIIPDKKQVQEKTSKSLEPAFRSVHRLPESKETQVVLEKLNGPKYNQREKKALNEVRKNQGKLYLLSDLYQEFTKEVEVQSAAELAFQQSKRELIEGEDNTKLVEDLDKWEKSKAKKSYNSTNQERKSPLLLPQIAKSPVNSEMKLSSQQKTPSYKSLQGSGVMSLQKENVKEGISQNSNPTDRSEDKINVKFGEGEDEQKEKSIEKIEVVQGTESMQELAEDILEISKSEDEAEKLEMERMKGMTIKQISDHHRQINEKKEEKINRKIKKLEAGVSEEEAFTRKMTRENETLEYKVKQLSRQMKQLEAQEESKRQTVGIRGGQRYIKKGSNIKNENECPFDDDGDDENPQVLKWRELKQNIDVLFKQIESNNNALLESSSRQKKYYEEIQQFNTAKKALYQEILLEGLDSRDEGLIWVLRKRIDAGDQVTIADFPSFLDVRTRKFLLEKVRALKRLNEVKMVEKATMEVFKTSREQLFDQETRFSNLFRADVKTLITEGHLNSMPVNIGSKSSLSGSPDIKSPSMKNAFRVDQGSHRGSELSDDRNRKGSIVTTNSPREGSVATVEVKDTPNSKLTENEEIYLKAKRLIKDSFKSEEERKEKQKAKKMVQGGNDAFRKAYGSDNETIKDHVKLYNENVLVNNYNSRKEFLIRMQALNTEAKARQEKIIQDTENEAARIVYEYQTNPTEKQVNLDVYLMSVFGHTEATKYLNKFGLGGPKFF